MRRADAVTTICDGLRDDIVGRGIRADKITVIPNAVSLVAPLADAADGAGLAARLGLRTNCVIGFIGSFYAYEGLALLLQALPTMLAGCPTLRLLLVGGGPQEVALRALVAELKLDAAVIFAGRVPHAQVGQYYRLIDVLVYPRLKMRLTDLVTPLKPLEAMAHGRPLLASDVGGHRELIADGRTGVLFAAGDRRALTAAVLDMLAHPERWAGLTAAGRAFVTGERNWYASVARYAGIYARLTARRHV
jgi:PEP-CTERM/exosortase A-associated glycosyltransferase